MKKFIALLLAAVLCMSLSAVAFAEQVENDMVVINWEDVEPTITEAGWEGEFLCIEDLGLYFWCPTILQVAEAPDDGNTYLGFLTTEDGEHVMAIFITDPVEGLEYDNFMETLAADENCDGLMLVAVNGLGIISYTVLSEGAPVANNASIVLDDGSVLSFVFSTGDEGFDAVAQVIVSSIQVAE